MSHVYRSGIYNIRYILEFKIVYFFCNPDILIWVPVLFLFFREADEAFFDLYRAMTFFTTRGISTGDGKSPLSAKKLLQLLQPGGGNLQKKRRHACAQGKWWTLQQRETKPGGFKFCPRNQRRNKHDGAHMTRNSSRKQRKDFPERQLNTCACKHTKGVRYILIYLIFWCAAGMWNLIRTVEPGKDSGTW